MNLNIQDFTAIAGLIFACTTIPLGFMWNHFNKKFDEVDDRFNKLEERFNKLEDKLDNVRDRVSRIEGQLTSTKIVPFENEPHSKKKVKGE